MTDNLPTWAQEALERAETATEGPWIVHPPAGFSGLATGDLGIYTKAEIGYAIAAICLAEYESQAQANAALIAYARTDVPRLCTTLATAIEALEEILEEAQSDLNRDIIITACESALAETQSIEPGENKVPEVSK